MNIITGEYMAQQETIISDMATEINKLNEFISKIHQDIIDLDTFVYMQDIPNPTIPEYVELHEKMVTIRGEISKIIAKTESMVYKQEVSHGRF